MKKYFLLLPLIFVACQTSQNSECCKCAKQTHSTQTYQTQNEGESSSQNLTPAQILSSASQLFNNGEPEEALKLLDNMPTSERNAQYRKLRQDVINKIVLNMRYKVRILYEKSLQQEGRTKRELLLQSRQILESIIKNYPEYNDMHSVKNNLKLIERELAKKS